MRTAHPGHCPVCGPTVFVVTGPWLRDQYRCVHCLAKPRQRALMYTLKRRIPNWRELTIFESSPSGPASQRIAKHCRDYTPSQFFDDVPSGQVVNGVRREDLRAMTLPDASLDLVITQDVFEHVVDPAAAFREIARVLRPGGQHIFTVPIYRRPETLIRVATHLVEPDYHGNPIGDGKSLVVREWGDDITTFIEEHAGTPTERYDPTSWWWGLRGEMKDVLVSRRSG
jgi:SAM-dependent methyltransferase